MFNDSREPLIEVAIQLLIVVLDYDMEQQQIIDNVNNADTTYEVCHNSFEHLYFLLVSNCVTDASSH